MLFCLFLAQYIDSLFALLLDLKWDKKDQNITC